MFIVKYFFTERSAASRCRSNFQLVKGGSRTAGHEKNRGNEEKNRQG